MALAKTSRRTIGLLCLQAIILILCIVYMQAVYYRNILPDKLASKQFESSTCFVLNKKIESKHMLIKEYRARFEIAYTVDNKNYKTIVYGNGLDNAFTSDRANQETLLNEFNQGEHYPCWVNPNFPHQAILVLRHNWESIFSLFIPAILFLLVTYSFLRTLFKFLRKYK